MEWKPKFIAALRKNGNVSQAAKAAKITRQNAYTQYKSDAEFKAAWDEALDEALDELESIAFKRAKDSSDTLLIFLLKSHRPEKYRETIKHETWQDEYIKAIRAGEVDYQSICDVLGDASLAEQLFRRAGVPVKTGES